MKFYLLINVKMPTFVGILTFRSRKNSIIGLSEPQKAEMLDIFTLMSLQISCSAELSMEKVLLPRGPGLIMKFIITCLLTLRAPSKIAADTFIIFYFYLSKKIRLDV